MRTKATGLCSKFGIGSMPELKMLKTTSNRKKRQLSMQEITFHEDWDEIGSNKSKKGHLLLKRVINSKLVGC